MTSQRYECHLSPELLEKAVRELNEPTSNEERLAAIDRLRESYDSDKFGPLRLADDGFLLRFLRAKKFDHKRALKVLHNYHRVRRELRDIFDKVENPDSLKAVMDSGVMYAVDGKSKAGEGIIVYRPTALSENVSIYELVAYGVLMVEELLKDEEYQICGSITIDDIGAMTFKAMRQVSFIGAKRLLQVWQDAMPVRMKTVYILNEGRVIDFIYALFKPFMNEKTKKRSRFCGSDFGAMAKEIDMSLLPPCVGGSGKELDVACKEYVEKLRQTF